MEFMEFLKRGLSIFAYKNTINMKIWFVHILILLKERKQYNSGDSLHFFGNFVSKKEDHISVFFIYLIKNLLLKLGWQINAAKKLKIKDDHSIVIFCGHPELMLKSNAYLYI